MRLLVDITSRKEARGLMSELSIQKVGKEIEMSMKPSLIGESWFENKLVF